MNEYFVKAVFADGTFYECCVAKSALHALNMMVKAYDLRGAKVSIRRG